MLGCWIRGHVDFSPGFRARLHIKCRPRASWDENSNDDLWAGLGAYCIAHVFQVLVHKERGVDLCTRFVCKVQEFKEHFTEWNGEGIVSGAFRQALAPKGAARNVVRQYSAFGDWLGGEWVGWGGRGTSRSLFWGDVDMSCGTE